MAKQIESSIPEFTRRSSLAWLAVLSGIVLLCSFVGVMTAFLSQNWPLATLFLLLIAGITGFAYVNFSQIRLLSAANEQKRIDWQTALPEIQRQNLNLEVFELSKILEVESEQISDLQSAYIVAEDLAMRQIQQEENVPLMRHVTLGKAPFDAVLVKDGVISCIEVAFLVTPDVRQEKVDAMMRKIALVKKAFGDAEIGLEIRLMMVLITQLTSTDGDRLRSVLNSKRFSNTPVDIDIRLLDFEKLQKIYVTD